MMKPKVLHRKSEPLGAVLKGTAVLMSDGWRGKVEQDCGGFVACIGDGERPNAHWLGDYRLVGRRALTINGSKAIVVNWKPKTAAAREQRQRDVVEYLKMRALEREWQGAPEC